MILGVDRFLDMCRTTVNVTGDLAAAVVVLARGGGAGTRAARDLIHCPAARPRAPPGGPLIDLRNVSRIYRRGADEVHALEHVSLSRRRPARFVALMGPSGSGKSTLAQHPRRARPAERRRRGRRGRAPERPLRGRARRASAAAPRRLRLPVLQPDPGALRAGERRAAAAPDAPLEGRAAGARRHRAARGRPRRARRTTRRGSSRAASSSASRSRARIVSDPEIIVADEPTGDLDAKNAEEILGLLRTLKQEFGKTVVMVTHDPRARALRRRGPPPRQGRAARDPARAARRPRAARRDQVPAPRLEEPRPQQDAQRAHRRRDRARDRAGLPAAHDARRPRRVARPDRQEQPHLGPQQGRASSTRCPTPTSRRCARCRASSRATSWTWFGGAFEEEKGVTFPNFAVDAEHDRRRLRGLGIDPQALADFQRYRDAALVGRADDEEVRLEDRRPRSRCRARSSRSTSSFRIVGEIGDERDPRFWFQREYLDQALEAQGVQLRP